MAEALTKAGRYQIVAELGRGSMGVVYQGFDPVIGRTVAIKTMLVEGMPSSEFEEYKARFQREAQAAGVLTHPNIVTVYDFGEDNGVLFLAMEFLEGKSIQQLVEKHTVMPIETIVPLFEQICSALDHAHQNKIVHRDVKPANIMILDSGLVKVTDFGIAKVLSMGMTQAGQILGTPNYMSPEQVKGRQIDGRSDIFSLGVILYELVTGERPFGGQNITTVIYKIINENPISPRELDASIHPGLCYVIAKALAKDPEERYQTCRELADDLRNYKNLGGMAAPSGTVVIKGRPLHAPPEPPPKPSYPQKPAAPPVERAYPPPPAAPRYSPPAEARYEPPADESAYAPEVGEVRPTAAVEPRRAPAAPIREERPPARPAPRPAELVAQPEAKRSSPVAWILLAVVLIAIMAGGGYYFFQQANKTSEQEVSPPPSSTASGTVPVESPKPNPPAPTPPSQPATQPAASGTTEASNTLAEKPGPAPAQPAPAAKFGKLVVEANVRGAEITLNGQDTGRVTPHTFTDLSPGELDVSLAKDGYSATSRRVSIEAGRTSTAKMELAYYAPPPPPPKEAEPETGIILINTTPSGLQVSIDDKPQGASPVKATLSPGDHTVTVSCPEGPSPPRTFKVKAGALASLTMTCNQ